MPCGIYEGQKFKKMKILTIIWGIIIPLCVIEAYFCTKLADDD